MMPWLMRDGEVLASVEQASTRAARRRGLLGRDSLEGVLVLRPCRQVHTLGMRFPIDVVFVDRRWVVVQVKPNLAPGRLPMPVWGAWGVLELAAGRIAKIGLRQGDQLVLREPLNGEEIVDSNG